MKNLIKGIGFLLALVAGSAQAIPTTLYFDTGSTGGLTYIASSKTLTLSGYLLSTPGGTVLAGSSMKFSGVFQTVDTITRTILFSTTTSYKGNFTGNSDFLINNGSTDLLTGKIDSLSLEGISGKDSGSLNGILNVTGGTLMNIFNNGNLFAIQVGLKSTTYSPGMYDNDFKGDANGSITSVPEPATLALLSLGVLLVGFTKRKNSSNIKYKCY